MTYELSDTPEAARDANGPGRHPHRLRLNKVPEITLYFWVIKVLCTTVGETAADLLNEKAGLGLTGVSVLMSALLAVVLVVQFRTTAYRAGVYWLAVALISVVGTLISDNLTDNMGVALETTTTVFGIILAVVFVVWYRRERTLSIHSIDTTSREAFYWLAVLFTFALGTAAGDLVSERMNLGYWLSAVLFALAIAAVGIAHFALGLDAVWSFWIAYILTRPLGASIGDYLSQPTGDGGLGLGTVVTSVLFLAVILGMVVFLTVTRKDVIDREPVAGQAA
ncbi:COG4705 family protein [Streptomyces xylophagus]|uniref:COG4705 family protein n=1 Tax=Streptomyces xylophagus TaxID=285514 RepID=UPI0005B9BE95|nr:membrane protein [Streptomyces xylophagus]